MNRYSNKDAAWLVIGSIHHINGIVEKRDTSFFLFLELPPALFGGGDNSVYIPLSTLKGQLPFTIRSCGGETVGAGSVGYEDLFDDLCFNPSALKILNKDGDFFQGDEALSMVPLFYVSAARGWAGVLENVTLYSQLRYSETDIMFIRTAALDSIEEPAAGGNSLLDLCVRHHADDSLFLGNHQCYYRKLDKEYESEYKLNLDCSQRIWDLTAEVYSLVKNGRMPGYILEYKDEFQKWDYYNHLFEVTAPEEERGYISFIPRTDGTFNVKRKIYKKDDLRRRESIRSAVKVEGALEEFLQKQFGFSFRRFPPFRRVRYDVNFESLRTGNVFGIFFDHVSVEGKSDYLVQCEIEYLRTRSLFDNREHMKELADIFHWTTEFLDRKGVQYTKTYYSKLSFLRDTFSESP